MAKRKTSKKATTKSKSKNTAVEENKQELIIEDIQEKTEQVNTPVESTKEIIKEEINEKDTKLIPDIDKMDEKTLKAKFLELENENAELRTTIEKARKKLRIYAKKLDLSEEREDQWKVACYNIAGVFAEKSHVALDDILKKFEAPIEDGASF